MTEEDRQETTTHRLLGLLVDRVEGFQQNLDGVQQNLKGVQEGLEEVQKGQRELGERLSGLEGEVERQGKRLEKLEDKVEGQGERLAELSGAFTQMDKRIGEQWSVVRGIFKAFGVAAGVSAVVGTAVLAIFRYFPPAG